MTKIASVKAIEVAEEADSIAENQINSSTIIVFCNDCLESNYGTTHLAWRHSPPP